MCRSERLQKRNTAIVHKFFELYDVKRMRMDDVLEVLANDHFFLDPDYIYSIVFYDKKNNDIYSNLVESISNKKVKVV